MSEIKISREVAEEEFERYCEASEVDCNLDTMGEDDRKAFAPIKNRFIRAVMAGRLAVNGRSLEYTVSDFSESAGEKVTINRPLGASFLSMDSYKDQQSVHKLQGLLAEMTGKDARFFAHLDAKDWMFFSGVATLFLVE